MWKIGLVAPTSPRQGFRLSVEACSGIGWVSGVSSSAIGLAVAIGGYGDTTHPKTTGGRPAMTMCDG